LIHGQQISADLLNAPRDSIAVKRSEDVEGFENHQGQRALQNISFLFHSANMLFSNRNGFTVPLGKQQVTHQGYEETADHSLRSGDDSLGVGQVGVVVVGRRCACWAAVVAT
jgi:hypothetical protein